MTAAHELAGSDFPGPITNNTRFWGQAGGLADANPDTWAGLLVYDYIKTKTDALYPTLSQLSSLGDRVTTLENFGGLELQSLTALAGASVAGSTDLLLIYDASASVNKSITPAQLAVALNAGLTVGASTITSGTTARVLYDNAGVLGEYAISGSGSVAMTAAPVFTTPAIKQYSEDVVGGNLAFYKARGSSGSPGLIFAPDSLGDILWYGWDGVKFWPGAKINCTATSGPAENHLTSILHFCPGSTTNPSEPIETLRVAGGDPGRYVAVYGLLRIQPDPVDEAIGTFWIKSDADGVDDPVFGLAGSSESNLLFVITASTRRASFGNSGLQIGYDYGSNNIPEKLSVAGNILVGVDEGVAGAGTPALIRGGQLGGGNNTAGDLTIQPANGTGTGTSGSLIFRTAPAGSAGSTPNTMADRWIINNTGALLAGADNSYDIGTSIGSRPKHLYLAGQGNAGVFKADYFQGASGGGLYSIGDGIMRFANENGNDFSRLTFGGTSSLYPSLKRTSAALICRLADDSADANFTAATLIASAAIRLNVAASTVGTGAKTISNASDSSTNFGHYFPVNLNGTVYYVPCGATAPT